MKISAKINKSCGLTIQSLSHSVPDDLFTYADDLHTGRVNRILENAPTTG